MTKEPSFTAYFKQRNSPIIVSLIDSKFITSLLAILFLKFAYLIPLNVDLPIN